MDVELGEVVLAGEDASAKQIVDGRVGVATGYEDALVGDAIVIVPEHGYAVGGVLAAQADHFGRRPGAQVLKTDQANAHDCLARL